MRPGAPDRFDDPPAVSPRHAIGGALLLLIGLGCGFLLGDCEGEPPPPPEPMQAECPAAPACEPCETEMASVAPPPVRPSRPRPRRLRSLPEVEVDPESQRAALLAWVRRETPRLRVCQRGEEGTDPARWRLTVRLPVADDGEVRGARVHASVTELTPRDRACLEEQLGAWEVPAELRQGHRELVFSVVL